MKLEDLKLKKTFLKVKLFSAILLLAFIGTSFAQDLHPSHNAYNSLISVVDAMKLERKSCAEIGYYPQLGQSLCASVPSAETFRSDWDLIVNQTGSSFGLSPLGDWTSEPARGVIHRTYLLGSTDLKVNYDVISSRITIDVLDPELQAQEKARRVAQAKADTAQQRAQAAYDTQQVQSAYEAQPAQAGQVQATQVNQVQQTINGYDVSAAYPTQQAQTTATSNGYYATNADGTAFALVDSTNAHTAANTVVTTPQVVTTQTANYAQTNAETNAVVDSRAYSPTPAATDGYATTASTNYAQTTNQAVAQTQAVQAIQNSTTSDYAYTPTNLITTMGTTAQNSQAFQPNGAWQITSSGQAVTIELYDTNTLTFLRNVYPDQIYRDAGNYYLSISGNAAWALSVWTE